MKETSPSLKIPGQATRIPKQLCQTKEMKTLDEPDLSMAGKNQNAQNRAPTRKVQNKLH